MENNDIKKFENIDGYSDFSNKKELKKFYEKSIYFLLQENKFLSDSDTASIFNCLLSLDDLYSKLAERKNYYSITNKKIIQSKIKSGEQKILSFANSIKIFELEIKTLRQKNKDYIQRIFLLENRITSNLAKIKTRKNKIDSEFKKYSSSLKKNSTSDKQLEKLELLKNDKEYKNQKLIDSYFQENQKVEDDKFKMQQEIPKISEKISNISEKISNSKNSIEDLKTKKMLLEESIKYKFISISENGKPYSNEVYQIKNFVKDVQTILKENGLTPLSRIKTNILLDIEIDDDDDDDLLANLRKNILVDEIKN